MVATTIVPLTMAQGTIQQLVPGDEAIIIDAALTAATAPCPCCGTAATRVQSRYWRTLADLPWQGVPVRVRLLVRRFWCEQLPTLAAW
jgi:transposase